HARGRLRSRAPHRSGRLEARVVAHGGRPPARARGLARRRPAAPALGSRDPTLAAGRLRGADRDARDGPRAAARRDALRVLVGGDLVDAGGLRALASARSARPAGARPPAATAGGSAGLRGVRGRIVRARPPELTAPAAQTSAASPR